MPEKDSLKQMQIKVDDKILAGVYSNAMQVQHSKEEFVIDFINAFPPAGTLNARIIVSPGHLKRMVATLADNLQKYENSYGKVEDALEDGEIIFKLK